MDRGSKRKPGVKLEDLCFYFDAVERDRLDSAGMSRRSGEVLALRERLLKLPEEEFDAAIKTLKTFVDDGRHQGSDDPAERRSRARTLYDGARPKDRRGGGASSTGKVSAT